MKAEDIVIVAGAVTILTQMVKWGGLPDSRGPLIVLALSFLGVMMWAISNESVFDRHLIWPYFAGWVSVSAAAAGVFGFTRALPSAVTSTKSPPAGPAGAGQNITNKS